MGAWQSYHSPDKHFSNSVFIPDKDKSYYYLSICVKVIHINTIKSVFFFSLFVSLYLNNNLYK